MPVSIPIFDGHNDLLLRLGDDVDHFFLRGTAGHIDLPRAREGGLAGGFCAVFVRGPHLSRDEQMALVALPGNERPGFPPAPDPEAALHRTLGGVARLLRLEARSNGQVRIVRTAADLETALHDGGFAAVLHLEGAEAITPDLDLLHVLYAAGLRSLGPVWSRPNRFGEGVPFGFGVSPDTGPGLTNLGRALIRECNRLRIVIDLSHLNEAGFWEVAGLSDAPLIATHSNAWAISPATRNLTDRQLDAIRESRGMVGVNFCVAFLREDCADEIETPLDAIVRQIDYLVERLGIEHVGFGSDFDGARIPRALGDAAGLPRLLDALGAAGYGEAELHRLAHRNWVDVLRRTWGS